jgi:predicted RNA-binding Zn-ribbon protein involved in translation (DUF1610 family)
MKARFHIPQLLAIILAASALISSPAYAGPGPQQIFRPVKDLKALSVLTPGFHVSHECPHCGTIGISKVGTEKSHAKGFTCPECKRKYTFLESGSGKARVGRFTCVDDKGRTMSAKVCASH